VISQIPGGDGKPPESFCHLAEVRCQLVIAVLVQLTKICPVARQRLRKEQAAATFEGGNSPVAAAESAQLSVIPVRALRRPIAPCRWRLQHLCWVCREPD
jgi:hypothetical protein